MMTVVACTAGRITTPSVVNDDSCGVHSRPYHSCVIACVMQVREEHAMGHDSGGAVVACTAGRITVVSLHV